jgi:hypothetical protein
MRLELADEQTEALIRELPQLIDGDPYPLSPRVRTLKAILVKLPPKHASTCHPPKGLGATKVVASNA